MDNKQTVWTLDTAHSEILFRVRHMMIANVKGEFRSFDGKIWSDGEDFTTAKTEIIIDATSVFTNNENRDTHLKSADFFHTENHPEIRFVSTGLTKKDDSSFEVKGKLSILGETKEITLDAEFGGVINDPYGNKRVGFTVSGKINRKDWGLNWNAAIEAGGVMVSDEVRINAEVQFTHKPEEK